MYFVNIIGDKYPGKSDELVTILMGFIECEASFSSPKPLHLPAF
jgi:hypothetical protein